MLFDFDENDAITGDDALCSGSLIAPTVFLTAAHCVSFFPAEAQLYVSFNADLFDRHLKVIAATEFHFDLAGCGKSVFHPALPFPMLARPEPGSPPVRGDDRQQAALFSYLSADARIPRDHPLRTIRELVDRALVTLSPRFDTLYAERGRPSIPPEQLLRALLLQVLYTIRSERQLMEQLDYNLLFRWFVGLELDAPVWDVTVFTKNRERLLAGDIAQAFFQAVLGEAERRQLLSKEHFTIDGTLVQAWAGQKSFQRRDRRRCAPPPDDPGNPTINFHGERRSNDTHASTTDAEARLTKRGSGHEAKLAYQGHVLMDNRYGLAVATALTQASGTAERAAAVQLVRTTRHRHRHRRITLGADKGYDTRECVAQLRAVGVTPHVAQQLGRRRSAVDQRTTRHGGYAVSQRKRKRVEEIFGWLKTIGLQRQTRFRGVARVGWMFTFATAAYNLVRLHRLLTAGSVG